MQFAAHVSGCNSRQCWTRSLLTRVRPCIRSSQVSSYAYKGRWYDPAASVDQSGSAARKLARWQSTQQPAGYTEHPIVGAHFDGVGMLALGTVDTSGNSINAALGGAITKVSVARLV